MANNIIACRKSFTDTLLELARQDKDIVAVTTDARGSVTLGDFAKELPAQFVECGIAEQDAVGISAGLSHSGKKVSDGHHRGERYSFPEKFLIRQYHADYDE